MSALLLTLALKGAVVLILGATAAWLLHRSPASLRHGVWAATFAVLLAVPVLDAVGPAWRVGVLPSPVLASPDAPLAPLAATPLPVGTSPLPTARPAFIETEREPAATASPVAAAPMTAPSSTDRLVATVQGASLATWLGGLWALGALVVALVWLRAFMLARRLVREAHPIAEPEWTERAGHTARRSGLEAPVRLLRSDALSIPIAWGFGRMAVVLPPQSAGWDDGRAEAVLLHEMAHLRRHDAWTQVVAQAALALYWPNPLAWIAYRRFMDAREQACDDAVLRVGSEATSYASHLVAVARELSPSRLTLAAVSPMAGRGELETRVRSILDRERRRDPVGRRTLAVALALAVTIGGPLAVFHPVAVASPFLVEQATPSTQTDLDAGARPDPDIVEDALQKAARQALRTLRSQSPNTLGTDWDDLEDRVMDDVSRALTAAPDLNTTVDVRRIIEDAVADAAPAIQQTLHASAPRIEQAVEQALLDAQPVIEREVELATRAALRQVSDQHVSVEIHEDAEAERAVFEEAHARELQSRRELVDAQRRARFARRALERATTPAERRSARAVLEDAQHDVDDATHDLEDAERDRTTAQRVFERAVESAVEGRIDRRIEARARPRPATRPRPAASHRPAALPQRSPNAL